MTPGAEHDVLLLIHDSFTLPIVSTPQKMNLKLTHYLDVGPTTARFQFFRFFARLYIMAKVLVSPDPPVTEW